jgi:PAS domain-containing protein
MDNGRLPDYSNPVARVQLTGQSTMESFHKNETLERPESVEKRLRLVIDTIPCLILCAKPDGAFDFINRRWLEFTGRKLEEVPAWGVAG